MNNDARFFFVFFGFVGFVTFSLSSMILNGELIFATLHGVLGCLFFSVAGRLLLSFALNNESIAVAVPSEVNPSSQAVSQDPSNQNAINFTQQGSNSINND